MVHAGGRPRDITPSPEECDILGKDLIEWASYKELEGEPKRLLFAQWYCNKHKMIRREWKALLKLEQFAPYYEEAKALLALKTIDGTMEKSFGHRYLRLYDQGLKEAEDEDKQFDADLKKQDTTENKFYFYYADPTKCSTDSNTSPLPMQGIPETSLESA